MLFVEDKAAFFNEFEVQATLAGNTFNVIFDRAYANEFDTDMRTPRLTAQANDFAAANQGDAIVVDGDNFVITDLQPDGTGMIEVLLHEA